MKHYYLIDFENVKSAGLITIQPMLKDGDHIYVFYSDKANTVNIEILTVLRKMDIKIKYIKVQNGQKDALDWQLSTFLGYLIRKHGNKKAKYHIVSKDHGFNILLSFWKDIDLDIIKVEEKVNPPRKKKVLPTHYLAIKQGDYQGVYEYTTQKERVEMEKMIHLFIINQIY